MSWLDTEICNIASYVYIKVSKSINRQLNHNMGIKDFYVKKQYFLKEINYM